jgi:hypothetical protein
MAAMVDGALMVVVDGGLDGGPSTDRDHGDRGSGLATIHHGPAHQPSTFVRVRGRSSLAVFAAAEGFESFRACAVTLRPAVSMWCLTCSVPSPPMLGTFLWAADSSDARRLLTAARPRQRITVS